MSEDERLTAIAAELVDDWHNERKPTLRVVHDDAAAIACGLHFEMDRLTGARAQIAEDNQLTIACEQGCSHCCESLVMVLRGESVVIAEWLHDPCNHELRDWFVSESYPGWREAIGDAPERAQEALRTDASEAYINTALEVWQKRVMCAFNRDGMCTVYDVRPNACRNSHALDNNENCQAANMQSPATIDFEDIQSFRFGTRPLTESLHQALGGRAGITSSVCQAVYELMTDPELVARAGRGPHEKKATKKAK